MSKFVTWKNLLKTLVGIKTKVQNQRLVKMNVVSKATMSRWMNEWLKMVLEERQIKFGCRQVYKPRARLNFLLAMEALRRWRREEEIDIRIIPVMRRLDQPLTILFSSLPHVCGGGIDRGKVRLWIEIGTRVAHSMGSKRHVLFIFYIFAQLLWLCTNDVLFTVSSYCLSSFMVFPN